MPELPIGFHRFARAVLLKPSLGVFAIVWSGISNSDTFFEKIVRPVAPKEICDKLQWLTLTQSWPGYVWAIGLLVILLVAVMWTSYKLYEAARRSAVDAVNELREYRKPRLRISIDPSDRDLAIEDPTIKARRVRVKVMNAGGKTIDDPLVRITRMEPPALPGYLPIPLLATHRMSAPVNPETPLMYDAFYKIANQGEIYLTHGVKELNEGNPVPFPATERRMVWIEASGRDCPKCEAKVLLRVLEDGSIQLAEVDRA